MEVHVTMKSVTALLVSVMVCLCVSGFAEPAPRGGGGMVAMSKIGPDLVIQEIIIREEGHAEFHDARVSVRVRNIGGGAAGESMTALVYSDDVTHAPILLSATTPGMPAGAHHEVDFLLEGIAGNLSGMLLAVADAPIATARVGQVAEGHRLILMTATAERIDLNNTFGVIFTTAGRTLPLRFKNPCVD